jgi:hypothetical protein
MAKYKVIVPNKQFNGERFGVKFENGEAVGEFDKHQLKDIALNGFKVEEVQEEKKETPKKAPTKKAPAKKTENK